MTLAYVVECIAGTHVYQVPPDSAIVTRTNARLLGAISMDECPDCLEDRLHQCKRDIEFHSNGDPEDEHEARREAKRVAETLESAKALFMSPSGQLYQRLR